MTEAAAMETNLPATSTGCATAAAFTNDLAATLRLAEELEVGSLWINEPSRFRLDVSPFGGVKESGVGREGVRYALEELSQLKFIGIRPTTGGN